MDNGRIVHRGRDGGARRRRGVAEPPARPLPGLASMSALDVGAALPRPKHRHPAGADAADRRGDRRAVHRLGLDLRHADRRRPGDGHDDLHHGVGPDARLRHDGRAEFRPRRLHFARRLCRDAGVRAARELGAGRIRWPLNLGAARARARRGGRRLRRSSASSSSGW